MFWGLIMEPQKRYTQLVKKAFHISKASLDISNGNNEPVQVMCGHEGRNYLLCTLQSSGLLQCTLDLFFEEGSTVSFATNGKSHVHLTGYLTKEFDEDQLLMSGDESAEAEEAPMFEVKAQKNTRSKVKAEGEPLTKRAKLEAEIKQEVEDEDDDSSDDSDFDVDALMKQSDDDDEDGASDDDDDVGEEEEDSEIGEEEDSADDEEGAAEEEDEDEDDEEIEDEEEEVVVKPKVAVTNGVDKKSKKNSIKTDSYTASINTTPMKKEQKKGKQQLTPGPAKVSAAAAAKIIENGDAAVDTKKKGANKEANVANNIKKKTLPGGVIIEDLKEGHGEVAGNGKFVHVYYEGRLKSNNKVFDKTQNGPGFGFRLGKGEVIKAWDVGVNGMKVGGKRRITCPPHLAYGAKGSPPIIPPNSTLVFEVEVKRMK